MTTPSFLATAIQRWFGGAARRQDDGAAAEAREATASRPTPTRPAHPRDVGPDAESDPAYDPWVRPMISRSSLNRGT
jgi:hypothetical protein